MRFQLFPTSDSEDPIHTLCFKAYCGCKPSSFQKKSFSRKCKPANDPEWGEIESALEETIVEEMNFIIKKYLDLTNSGGIKLWKEKKWHEN